MLDVVSVGDQRFVDCFAWVALDYCYHSENYSQCNQEWNLIQTCNLNAMCNGRGVYIYVKYKNGH